MKNINEKVKKWLIISGGLVLSAVLLVAIMSQFKAPPTKDLDLLDQNSSTQKIAVETPDITEKEDDIKVPPIEIEKESNAASGIDKGTEQTIQPNPAKPEYTDEQLKNPDQKPNGEKVTEQDKPVEHNKVEKPSTPPKSDNQPQGGEKKNGQIYVPGFGWIDDIGEGQGTVVDGEGDINKQVGIMGN
jgi:cytoskeletal protein RodZ